MDEFNSVSPENESVKINPVCEICGKPTNSSSMEGSYSDVCECKKEVVECDTRPGPDLVVTSHDADTAFPQINSDLEIVELIGEGGMSHVYRAKHNKLNKELAVKVLKAELAQDKQATKRFEQEARAVSSLEHENLVAVYSHGKTTDGAPYIVMDFIEGHTLGEKLKKIPDGHLTVQAALDVLIQTCEALSYAHAKGVIHRDLKPSNIMLPAGDSEHLQVRVVDFGIAKVVNNESADGTRTDLTQTGDIFGSPIYMSPEQCHGLPQDSRSDVYSLGCVMYEILTGVRPFAGSNPIKVILNHINEDARPITSLSGFQGFSKSLETIVLKCLEKKPENRYSGVDDVLRDLRDVKAGRPIKTKLVKRKKSKQRSRFRKWVSATLVGITIGVSIPVCQILTSPEKMAGVLDGVSYVFFSTGQYTIARPMLEYGIDFYRQKVFDADRSGDANRKLMSDIMLAENIQHVGKCYLKMAASASSKGNMAEADSLYQNALKRYRESWDIWQKYSNRNLNLKGSLYPELVREYAKVLKILRLDEELKKVILEASKHGVSVEL